MQETPTPNRKCEFDGLEIDHLRSHIRLHPDPFDVDSLEVDQASVPSPEVPNPHPNF